MPKVLFVVRSTVTDSSERASFDDWYRQEQLPDAVRAFGVKKAWRCWSADNPSVHLATYQFSDNDAFDRATGGDAIKALVTEFDRCWPEVKRTREILVMAEEWNGA